MGPACPSRSAARAAAGATAVLLALLGSAAGRAEGAAVGPRTAWPAGLPVSPASGGPPDLAAVQAPATADPSGQADQGRSGEPGDRGDSAADGSDALAGSRAGEGRAHPGRSADQPDLTAPLPDPQPAEGASASGTPGPDNDAPGPDAALTGPQQAPLPDAPAPDHRDGEDQPAQEPAGRQASHATAAPGRPEAGASATATIAPDPAGQRPGAAARRRPGGVRADRYRQAAPGYPAERLRLLPLGFGMALVGLGIAVFGLRLRRR